MLQKSNNEEVILYKNFQWVVVIFSAAFFFVIANGYFNLFVSTEKIIAIVIGVGLASLAWSLAKFIGGSRQKISGNIPLFILLLIISAVGVFNALMINLEGKQIYQETIDDSSVRFRNLSLTATKVLKNPLLEDKRVKVDSLKRMFFEELHNPQNCGQGHEANILAQKIKEELPEFRLLSGSNVCSNVDKIIASYDASIEKLLVNSREFISENYTETQSAKNEIIQKELSAQDQLISIKKDMNDGGNLLSIARMKLEEVSSKYQNSVLLLYKYSPTIDLPRSLDMKAVRSLGEWSQGINLLISRLDNTSTYVYLFLAVFADWILIYLFSRLSDLKNQLPNRRVVHQSTNISTPW